MALKESLKLEKTEVKHEIIAGSKEQLDVVVTGWLNAGWKLNESRMILFDRNNNIIEVFYIL